MSETAQLALSVFNDEPEILLSSIIDNLRTRASLPVWWTSAIDIEKLFENTQISLFLAARRGGESETDLLQQQSFINKFDAVTQWAFPRNFESF